MSGQKRPYVIAIEEHYWDREVADKSPPGGWQRIPPFEVERLYDLFGARLKEMDESGIDIQVLSMAPLSAQVFDAQTGPAIARGANDRLRTAIDRYPDRFRAFATLPTANPEAAADELERAVKDLGFKGAMINGMSNGYKFLDLPEFWPIYARAEKLDVPIYIHPAMPHPGLIELYLKDYVKDFPSITSATWGFTVETATHALRFILSGMFERFPNLKIILGHLGESLPFLLWRIDYTLSFPMNKKVAFAETFRKNFYITTSGNFSTPALLCTVMEMGTDHILFSVDYPYVMNKPAIEWMKNVPLASEDREKLYNGNARQLLRI